MFRTHNCGELKITDINKKVTLSGWINIIRNKGSIIWIDLRDRYGITQLVLEEKTTDSSIFKKAKTLGREDVIKVKGTVSKRTSKNEKISTGEIEIVITELEILNSSKIPPFTIENDTDGGEELRMKYRYLDIRRPQIRENLILRHQVVSILREYLNKKDFIEIETPSLIKSTPEGARDFLVPSRMNPGKFYALPQSPQTLKQLLMIGGMDKYYQLVKCFRDEDLRADRAPEFTQIDCEMSFIEQQDIFNTFEPAIQQVFNVIKGVTLPKFPVYTYDEVMSKYGTDKPDLRFDMQIIDITEKVQKCNFKVFDNSEYIGAICVKNSASFTRKQIDIYTDFIKNPNLKGKGLVYIKYNEDDSIRSSIDKFILPEQFKNWFIDLEAKKGDLVFVIADKKQKAQKILGELRLKLASDLNLKDKNKFAPLWVIDFPLLEWNEEHQRFFASHHPFTSPKDEDIVKMTTDPANVKAKAYDLVMNGFEIAGGSLRIHKKDIQEKMFKIIGMDLKQAYDEFGFLINALGYGAPPHGGIAIGLARLCAILGGSEAIRDFIAFPKNNSGKDIMIDAPSLISSEQLKELNL
ncbi:MAG: aspartate--tRNA ligase [Bacteroidetes bacterium]|nr:aspartate--tRNA ligase [Bacteroidota bacterium]